MPMPAAPHKSESVVPGAGLRSPSTMIVMMMASTPSLNASRRLVRIAPGYQCRPGYSGAASQVGEVPVAWRLAALPGQLADQAVAGPQHGLGLVRVHRHGQQVALAELAAHRGEQLPL